MSDTYLLARNSTEAGRLNKQHDIWTKNLNYLLHPAVKPLITPTSRIADIGCGTARFLCQLAEEIPKTCQLDGFDISSALFPDDEILPSNVALHVHDALTPFPDDFHGQYDVAHLRLLVAALDEGDWATMVSQSLALLRPGGAIQWDEGDMEHLKYYRGGPAGTIDAGLALEKCLMQLLGGRRSFGWSTLPRIFESMGLKIERDMVSTDRDMSLRREATETSLVSFLAIARSLARRGRVGPLGDLQAIDEFEKRLYEEFRNGLYMRYDIYVCVGFKPYNACS